MKYGHDQREWVRVADEKLPALREEASKAQKDAAEWFDGLSTIPESMRQFWTASTSEAYAKAQMLLTRVLYYEGMRRANLPKED